MDIKSALDRKLKSFNEVYKILKDTNLNTYANSVTKAFCATGIPRDLDYSAKAFIEVEVDEDICKFYFIFTKKCIDMFVNPSGTKKWASFEYLPPNECTEDWYFQYSTAYNIHNIPLEEFQAMMKICEFLVE